MNIHIGLFALLMAFSLNAAAVTKNGFDFNGSLVPADNILPGGPERDGIPAIDQPQFVSANAASFLKADDYVLGLDYRGVRRAYPIRILNWHEIVNDTIGGEAVAITFCPLCGTGLAYSGNIGGNTHRFGVSGLLYNSDVLLYDRETESLWSQILSKAVSGPLRGQPLTNLGLKHTTWEDWRKQHPDTEVLSTQTGYQRDYSRSPYSGYDNSESLYFPVTAQSHRYHPKERVLGVQVGNTYKAYPFSELAKTTSPLQDTVGKQVLRISFDANSRSGEVHDSNGKPFHSINSFWFAWYAYHPSTEVFTRD